MVTFLKQKVILSLFILSFVLLFLSLVLFSIKSGGLSSPLILHFDDFRGIDWFGEKTDVLWIWFTGLVALLINSILSRTVFYKERFLSYLFLGSNVLIAFLILVFISVVISVN